MINEFNPEGKDIRFIDSHYKDLFHIPDGGTIQVHYSDDSVVIKPCIVVPQNKVPVSCAKAANYNRIFINLSLTACRKKRHAFFLVRF